MVMPSFCSLFAVLVLLWLAASRSAALCLGCGMPADWHQTWTCGSAPCPQKGKNVGLLAQF